jgi:pimeloyl-ACP methyl ester carboxylesterase
VHGAFAAPWGWNGVIAKLKRDGYRAIAAVNPLRSLPTDAASIAVVARSIPGDVVLVGHSCAGLVITEAARRSGNVKALVYVAAFIPEIGESALTLSLKFPGSTLGDALQPAMSPALDTDLHIQPANFHRQFAADVPANIAALMAATRRPITRAAMLGDRRQPPGGCCPPSRFTGRRIETSRLHSSVTWLLVPKW